MVKAVVLILLATVLLGVSYSVFVQIKQDKSLYKTSKSLFKIFSVSLGVVLSVVSLLIIFS